MPQARAETAGEEAAAQKTKQAAELLDAGKPGEAMPVFWLGSPRFRKCVCSRKSPPCVCSAVTGAFSQTSPPVVYKNLVIVGSRIGRDLRRQGHRSRRPEVCEVLLERHGAEAHRHVGARPIPSRKASRSAWWCSSPASWPLNGQTRISCGPA